MFSEDDAHQLIELVRTCRPTCADCETGSSVWARHLMTLEMRCGETLEKFMAAQGYEADLLRDCFTRRCSKCKTSKEYPWANRLDAKRVVEFVNAVRMVGYTFAVLEKTIETPRGGLEFL